jgi:hypothetical protein
MLSAKIRSYTSHGSVVLSLVLVSGAVAALR